MWRRSVCTEKQARDQPDPDKPSNVAREIAAAIIKSAKANEIPIGRNVAVAAEKATGALPEIGNDHNIGLVISGAGFQPSLPLAHVIGCSEIGVAISTPDLQATEFVDQEEVDHASDRVRSVDS